jgi:hypothetical protein
MVANLTGIFFVPLGPVSDAGRWLGIFTGWFGDQEVGGSNPLAPTNLTFGPTAYRIRGLKIKVNECLAQDPGALYFKCIRGAQCFPIPSKLFRTNRVRCPGSKTLEACGPQ